MVKYRAKKHEGINPGGDCGPCCLAGVTFMDVKAIYENYFHRIDGVSYGDMISACYKLYWDLKIKAVDNKLVAEHKIQDPEYATFGNPSWENFNNWFKHVIQKTSTGWVGIAQVHQDGKAAGDLKHQFYTNHWVLIIGGQDDKREFNNRLVHISCPTKGVYSVPPLEFLMNYGGYNTIWVLPLDE